MFGIDFSEFLIIGIVALIVLGPERLPKMARTAGHLFGRLQRYAADVKQQVKREIEAEDFKQIQSEFQEMKDAAGGVEHSIRQEISETQSHLMTASDTPQSSLEFVEDTYAPPSAAPMSAPLAPQLELPLSTKPEYTPGTTGVDKVK